MGIFDWVKSQTGDWGPALMDAYIDNSFWINALVLLYGLLLLLAWQNLSRITDVLIEQMVEQAIARGKTGRTGAKDRVVHFHEFDLSWQQASASSKFPFIARQTGILIRRNTLNNLRALITERDLIQRSARRLNRIGVRLEAGR